MFGYITVFKPEMKVKDYEIYKAIYCGLCRHMGKTYGALSKFCLSYDMTFISLLQMALKDTCNGYEQKSCRVNPFKKCTYCKNDQDEQDLTAAAAVALTDMKVRDNIADNGFLGAIPYFILGLFTKRWSKKAFKKYPELLPIINDYSKGQQLVESTENCSIDLACEPSAKAVARILTLIKCNEKYKFILERIGYCLGKWIYLCDIADDIEKDIKKGNFNPLRYELGVKENAKDFTKKRLSPIMNTCRVECANHFELLEIKKYREIVENILYDGLKYRQDKIFEKEQGK